MRSAIAAATAAIAVLAASVAAAQVPDAGGDESAAITLPPAGKEFGYNGLFNAYGADTSGLASLAKIGGASSARMPLEWWGVESVRDSWNETVWLRHATAYETFLAQGIRPHFVIGIAPPWARDAGEPRDCLDRSTCRYPPARDMLGEWRQFAAEVARRFPQATVEVWNEPNSLGQWRTGVDPARYAELLAAAYEAIKARNPSQTVMMGGLAENVGPESVALRTFLEGAYAATPSLRGHTDALNFHTYTSGNLKAGSPFSRTLADVREVRAAHGDASRPLFVSETGQTTTGAAGMTEAQQADVVLRTVRKLLTMSDVSGVLVHTLVDRSEYAEDDPEHGFGVLHDSASLPLVPKRAFCELSRAAGTVYSACPPLARIDAGPQGFTRTADPVFSFSSAEPASFRCSLDGAAFEPCASPVTLPGLTEGTHRFAVQAVDALGRFDPEPVVREFTVDTVAPDTTLWGPSGPIATATPRVAPGSPDASARLECSLNGAPYAPCASSVDLGPLADGEYTYRARAVDPAGNVDPTPAVLSFRVDTRAPVASFSSGPSGLTTDGQPTFGLAADESDVRFLCAFNGKALGACASSTSHTPAGILADGSYSVQTQAIDAAGNRRPVISRSFTVDRTGPAVTITAPASPTNDSTPVFQLNAAEPGASFECRFDSDAFQPCSDAPVAAPLADGYHALEARGVDSLGNRGPVARNVFVVDTRAPNVAFTAAPPSLISVTSATFEFQADEGGSTLECSLDGAGYSRCSSPLALDSLAEQVHRLRVRAIDRAGNVGAAAERSFTVDLTGPAVRIDSGVEGPTQQVQPTFGFSSEAGVTFECRFDAAEFGACSAPSSHRPATALAEGPHRFEVRARDRAGNLGPASGRSFTVDRTAPEPPAIELVGARQDGWLASSEVRVALASTDPGVSFECAVDGAQLAPCMATAPLGPLAEGPHWIRARAVDAAGNVSTASVVKAIIDLTAPDTDASAPLALRGRAGRFSFRSTEERSTFKCSVDRRPFRACPSEYRPRRLRVGRHVLRVVATDPAGNTDPSPAKVRFRVKRR